ncbi:hypothetical protein ABIE49_007318 [Bradyrhizobium sp. OAE829]
MGPLPIIGGRTTRAHRRFRPDGRTGRASTCRHANGRCRRLKMPANLRSGRWRALTCARPGCKLRRSSSIWMAGVSRHSAPPSPRRCSISTVTGLRRVREADGPAESSTWGASLCGAIEDAVTRKACVHHGPKVLANWDHAMGEGRVLFLPPLAESSPSPGSTRPRASRWSATRRSGSRRYHRRPSATGRHCRWRSATARRPCRHRCSRRC